MDTYNETMILLAVINKQITEINATFKGILSDIPLEAFFPEKKEAVL